MRDKRVRSRTMSSSRFEIRRANKNDVAQLGAMGAGLARFHHEHDEARFLYWDDMASGYGWWLGKELDNEQAVVLVAARGETLVGYAYGRAEERDWNMLLDAHGALHDIWVEPAGRRDGVGRALCRAMIEALEVLGVPRIVLSTAVRNEAAQKLFASLGWRPTMLEMTRERG
jgi:ribosomal protein S18 acetylase RimI-like enzyme